MYVESLWIENFRNIHKLKLEGLGPLCVFYGENGAGKSNILEAIGAIFRGLGRWKPGDESFDLGLGDADVRRGAYPYVDEVVLGATLRSSRPQAADGQDFPKALAVEFRRFVDDGLFRAAKLEVAWNGGVVDLLAASPEDDDGKWQVESGVRRVHLAARQFRLVPAVRSVAIERAEPPGESTAPGDRIGGLLSRGRLKHALVESMTSPDIAIRSGLDTMRKMLGGPPLHRPPFDPVYNPSTQAYELTEVSRTAEGALRSAPLDLAGLGVQQVYAVLAGVLVTGASIAAVEEPEAHLHPRTTGRQLRALLQRCVDEHHVQQLFVATHSNLFDLDSNGFWLVRNDKAGGTVVERSGDFARLDREVFWEPGPARAALLLSLRDLPTTTIVFRRGDGTPVTAAEMLVDLQADGDDALAFVADVQSLAVGTVRRLANRLRS